ncbi:46059_t:CDS:2 [Gigaspora margarita]|uniref:46059_t:CDS:1 n=1 Tax=Gigaspora margarita TaxID=4874 RepID=A0ABM8VWV7_GIGMA|nr:46059_t:CDS:2 [Gigaspora margarita]
MAQTIAKFVELDREDAKNLKHPYVVWKMENQEGWFWDIEKKLIIKKRVEGVEKVGVLE